MEMAYLKNEIALLNRRINKLGDDLANNEKCLKRLEEHLSDMEEDNKKHG